MDHNSSVVIFFTVFIFHLTVFLITCGKRKGRGEKLSVMMKSTEATQSAEPKPSSGPKSVQKPVGTPGSGSGNGVQKTQEDNTTDAPLEKPSPDMSINKQFDMGIEKECTGASARY